MIESVHELLEAIEELNISRPCKLRLSIDGTKILKIIGLTCIEDDRDELICDLHLETDKQSVNLK